MSAGAQWGIRIIAVLGVVAAGAFALWRELPEAKKQVEGYSFSETLPKVLGDAGAGARVLSILDQNGNVSFAVVTRDGRVLERYFGEVCTSSANGPGNACSKRAKSDSRKASAGERRRAVVSLDTLDAGVVDTVRKESGAAKAESVGLRGRMWAVAGAHAGVAAPDGSGFHAAATPREQAAVKAVGEDSGLR